MERHSLIERLARHLAAGDPEGWPNRVEDAASILAILKEPDAAMCEAGDENAWRAMVDAALRERWSVAPLVGDPHGPGGSDEEGEIRLSEGTATDNRAGWVHNNNSDTTRETS